MSRIFAQDLGLVAAEKGIDLLDQHAAENVGPGVVRRNLDALGLGEAGEPLRGRAHARHRFRAKGYRHISVKA